MKSFTTRLLVIAFLMTISFAASAQIYVGGSIGGSYAKAESTNAKSWAIDISPKSDMSLMRIGQQEHASPMVSPCRRSIASIWIRRLLMSLFLPSIHMLFMHRSSSIILRYALKWVHRTLQNYQERTTLCIAHISPRF